MTAPRAALVIRLRNTWLICDGVQCTFGSWPNLVSTMPLRIANSVGLVTALIAFGYGGIIIFKTLVYGETVRGYPSLMTVMLFLGGIQLMALGMIGEYLGRMFEETKQRPLYLLDVAVRPGEPEM